jgi:hypothetical protein
MSKEKKNPSRGEEKSPQKKTPSSKPGSDKSMKIWSRRKAGRQEQQQQMEDVCIWILRRQKSAEIVKDCKTYYCHCKISVSSLLLPSCLSSS